MTYLRSGLLWGVGLGLFGTVLSANHGFAPVEVAARGIAAGVGGGVVGVLEVYFAARKARKARP